MAMKHYLALISPGEAGGYGVVFPDFPGCVTVGATPEEAQENAVEALCLHIEGMLDDGEELPKPSHFASALPAWLADEDLSDAYRLLVPIEIDSASVRVNITMEGGLLARLDRVAEVRGVSRSAALAEATRQWIRVA